MDDPKAAMQAALKDAMKSKDSRRRDAIRLLMSAIKQVEIDKQKELSGEDVIDVLQKEAKIRRESLDELRGSDGEAESIEQQEYELSVIETFLPEQLSRDEIEALARTTIEQVGAQTPKEMGKVMGALQPQVKGRADGKLVSQIVRDLLNG